MNAVLDALRADIGVPRASPWIVIDQAMIDRFADATLDRQFIHVDPARAALTPFGGTIAHGLLSLSLLPHLIATIERPAMPPVRMGINYGFDRVRFVSPIAVDSRIRAIATLAAIDKVHAGTFRQTLDIAVAIDGHDKPALIATWITQLTV